jgi:hypothetical protein
MQVASDMWQKHAKKSGLQIDPTVVFTTEATSMVEEQKAFVAQNQTQRYPFNFEFVTNTKDVTPDSGFMKEIGKVSLRSRRYGQFCLPHDTRAYCVYCLGSLCFQCRRNHAVSDVVAQGATRAKSIDWKLLFELSCHVERLLVRRMRGGFRQHVSLSPGI